MAQVESERDRYRALYLEMLERCKKLERGILAGSQAEKLSRNEAQLTLSILGTLLGKPELAKPSAAEPESAKKKKRAPRAKRPPLPAELPLVTIEVLPEDVQREGLDAFERIGEDACEVIERRPGSLVRVRVIRPKFVRRAEHKDTRAVATAPAVERPIGRALAGPGLMADTLVRRFEDHLPLSRMEQIYAREGFELSRSTVCGWHNELGARLRPLIAAMWADAHGCDYLCTDATGVRVQAKERCRNGHFFVVIAPERHVLYLYSPRHDSEAVDRMLSGYRGYLVADAHTVYDHLYTTGEIQEVGCWAHARRYFFKSLSSDPERARVALAWIGELFRIEREITEKGGSLHARLSARLSRSKPILDAFFEWCKVEAAQVLDETPIADGIRYAGNQKAALSRFLENARLPLHNNSSELALRRQAVGRKSWLFLGNDAAGAVNACFVSLLASCRMHGIEPWAYLRDLLCLVPDWKAHRVLELAPAYWRKTLEQPETQQRLSANPFRQVSMGVIR